MNVRANILLPLFVLRETNNIIKNHLLNTLKVDSKIDSLGARCQTQLFRYD